MGCASRTRITTEQWCFDIYNYSFTMKCSDMPHPKLYNTPIKHFDVKNALLFLAVIEEVAKSEEQAQAPLGRY